jgi:hypothetical protein
MGLVYKLVGFDRDTEYLALSFDIPGKKIRKAKIVAGIADNPAIVADWPLSREQAKAIAELIGAQVDVPHYDWALEPYPASRFDKAKPPTL